MKKKILLTVSVLSLGFTIAGCKDNHPNGTSETAITDYTKDSLLEAVKASELLSDETLDDGETVKHTYSNGAVATVKDGKVFISLNEAEYEYNINEYADTLTGKELITESSTYTVTDAVPETPTVTTVQPTKASEVPAQTNLKNTVGTDIQEGTWVQFDDGTMKYYRPEEIFTYVDGNGNEYKFNYDEWEEFQKTGKIPE